VRDTTGKIGDVKNGHNGQLLVVFYAIPTGRGWCGILPTVGEGESERYPLITDRRR